VYKCEDKNANGICREPLIDRPLPGVEVCIEPVPNGQAACRTTDEDGYARWQDLSCGSYVVTEHLTGLFRGYYPSSPMSQDVGINENETAEVTFSNVFPLIPRGIAVNPANDKVYAAFQGIKEPDGTRPYPFVAVIDSHVDQVIATIPNIGREPFGVAVVNNKVYVASFREGLLSVIDSQTDQIIRTITGFANPTRLAADPANNLLYVTDHGDGRVHIVDTTNDTVIEQLTISGPTASDPYDVAFSDGFAYTTLRDAPLGHGSNPFFLQAAQYSNQLVSIPLAYQNQTGSPHAIAAQTHGADTYLYITYAKDFRNSQPPYEWPPDNAAHPTNNPVNPTHLTVVEVPEGNPAMAHRLGTDLPVGDFAEIGLIFNPNTNHLLGTYGGGFFEPAYPDQLACALIPKGRADSGSAYVLDATNPQNPQLIDKPTPGLRVGNSVAPMTGDFWWRNPFDIAVNPNNNKIYVTDRCWHDYDDQYDNLFPDHELWHDGGGAVFVFSDDSNNPHPPTATPTSWDEVALSGQVNLQGRVDNQGATVTVDNAGQTKGSASTDTSGHFRIDNLSVAGALSITADAPAYLPAVCTGLEVTNPEMDLGNVTLLSGDFNDDDMVDIFDMTMVGSHYGQTGPDLLTDVNRDGTVDIYDLILVNKNSEKGAQVWNCS
jgi:YVTN family beta-propeller protein